MLKIEATIIAAVTAGALATSLLIGSSTIPAVEAVSPQETELFTGRLVDLHKYVTHDPNREKDQERGDGDQRPDRDPGSDGAQDQMKESGDYSSRSDYNSPLALVVDRDRLIGTTREVYVLIFDMRTDNARSLPGAARQEAGKHVSIMGSKYERDGVKVIKVREVRPAPPDRDRD